MAVVKRSDSHGATHTHTPTSFRPHSVPPQSRGFGITAPPNRRAHPASWPPDRRRGARTTGAVPGSVQPDRRSVPTRALLPHPSRHHAASPDGLAALKMASTIPAVVGSSIFTGSETLTGSASGVTGSATTRVSLI